MKLFHLMLICAVFQLSRFSSADAAPRDAMSYGGNGGGQFRAQCKDHYALFAYTGRAGKALDHIRPLCAEVRSDGGQVRGSNKLATLEAMVEM